MGSFNVKNVAIVSLAIVTVIVSLIVFGFHNGEVISRNDTITRGRQLRACSTITEQAAKALCVQKVVSY